MNLCFPLRRGRAALRRLARCERGVTLTELIVTLAILGTVIGSLTTLFTSGAKAESDLNLRFQSQSAARLALDQFRREVHNACSATASGTSAAVTDPGGTSRTLYPTLTLRTLDSSFACTVTSATWCTAGSGSNFALYRQAGATCSSSGGSPRAQYLIRGTVFGIPAVASTLLPKVLVDFNVNRQPSTAQLQYRLFDAIALRNARRG